MRRRRGRTSPKRSTLLALVAAAALLLAACGEPPKDLAVKDGRKTIPDFAYPESESLETLFLPASVTAIGKNAFSGCKNLRSVTLSEGLEAIGPGAFEGCESLTSIVIPSTVTDIGDRAFMDCVNLRSVTLSEGLTRIGDRAFKGCQGLTSIVIPDTVDDVGEFAFGKCESLTDATLPGDARYHHPFQCGFKQLTVTGERIDDSLYWALFGDAWHYDAQDALESLTIAEPIAAIPDMAFNLCRSLRSVALPDTLTSIGESAFRYSKSLESVELPEGLAQIGPEAFAWGGLTAVSIPDSVLSIGNDAFRECPLESADMPACPDFVGNDPFCDCWTLYRWARENFPAELEDAEDVRSREGVLIPDGARVVPMDAIDSVKDNIVLNGALYNVMPEDVRTADWSTADYAIVMDSRSYRNKNVTIITTNAYGTTVNSGASTYYSIYLVGRDGSAWLLHDGGNLDAEGVWERIRGFFPGEAEEETAEPEPEIWSGGR